MEPAGQALTRRAGAAPAFLRIAVGLAVSAAMVLAVQAAEVPRDGSPDPDQRAQALVRAMDLGRKINQLHRWRGVA
jgi:hypothetical protein